MLRKTRRCTFAGIWGEHTDRKQGRAVGGMRAPPLNFLTCCAGKFARHACPRTMHETFCHVCESAPPDKER